MKSKGLHFSNLFTVLSLAFLLVACGDVGDPEDFADDDENDVDDEDVAEEVVGDEDSDVELTVWLWSGFAMEEQIDEFAEENNMQVNIQVAEYGDTHENLLTTLAAGSGSPDVTAIDEGYLEQFLANPDHFYDLMDYGAAEVEDEFLDWKWEQGSTPEGQVVGLPVDIGPIVMAYQPDLFEEAGLPTDREEVAEELATWDDYIEAGRDLREETGSSMIDTLNDMYRVLIEQGDEKYFQEDGTLILEDNPHIAQSWEYITEAHEADISHNLDPESPEWGAATADGEFATTILPSWELGAMEADAPDASGDWDITHLPEGSGNWGGSFLSIPAESDNPEEAYELIEWLTAPEQQLQAFGMEGQFPSTPDAFDEPEIIETTHEYFSDAPTGELFAEAAVDIEFSYEGPDFITVQNEIEDAITRIEDGNEEPDESWESAIDEIERQLAR